MHALGAAADIRPNLADTAHPVEIAAGLIPPVFSIPRGVCPKDFAVVLGGDHDLSGAAAHDHPDPEGERREPGGAHGSAEAVVSVAVQRDSHLAAEGGVGGDDF